MTVCREAMVVVVVVLLMCSATLGTEMYLSSTTATTMTSPSTAASSATSTAAAPTVNSTAAAPTTFSTAAAANTVNSTAATTTATSTIAVTTTATSTSAASATAYIAPEAVEDEDDCSDQIMEYSSQEVLDRLKKYDVEKVLEGIGGAPGKVNVTWFENTIEFPISNSSQRPLLDAGNTTHQLPPPPGSNSSYWLYDYRATDWKTFIRLEHALLRFPGTAAEFLDVRGEVWWTPPDLCGGMRHALYLRDDTGFHSNVLRAHCRIFTGSKDLVCFGPDSENQCAFCISGLSGSLVASLVG